MTYNVFSGTLNPTQSINQPCPCSPMVKPLGHHVQYSVTFEVAQDRLEPRPGRIRLLKKNYFK